MNKKDPQKRPTKETYKRDLQKRPTKETCEIDPFNTCLERYLKKDCLVHQKRPVHMKRDLQKRPMKEIYTRDLWKLWKRSTKGTNKRDLQKRPMEAIYKRDQWKRSTKETYERDLQKKIMKEIYKRNIKEIYKRDQWKRSTKETYERDLQKRHKRDLQKKEIYKRDLWKTPMKETHHIHTLRELCASKETSTYGKRHWKETWETDQQKKLVKETYQRDPPCICLERTLKRDCLLRRKRPVHVKRDLEKRPIRQIYKRDQ